MGGLRSFGLVLIALLSGCASYGVIQNAPLGSPPPAKSYSLIGWNQGVRPNDLQFNLAFSGGGTRAAAFSYGVLKALRDAEVPVHGRKRRLLDEVDAITSVSGGSFTAAYYGLYGERTFEDFETVFLKRDVERHLLDSLLNPFNWFGSSGRTEWAIDYYQEHVFHGATFADMARDDRPLIVINTSDLGYGVRFSFLQEYFNLLCSDLTSFPVARAVAASSAVPVVFNPVVVQNYPECGSATPAWLQDLRRRAAGDARLTEMVSGLESYFDREKRKYAHFVDGGITDNLGLRAMFDFIEAAGGPKAFLAKSGRTVPRHFVVIVVNASTDPEPVMDLSTRQPSLIETVNAMSDIQLHRYNADTLQLMKQSVAEWAKTVSTPERPIATYFIELSFRSVAPQRRSFFNSIPTSFALSSEQVDALVAAGAELLHANPEFRRLLVDIAR